MYILYCVSHISLLVASPPALLPLSPSCAPKRRFLRIHSIMLQPPQGWRLYILPHESMAPRPGIPVPGSQYIAQASRRMTPHPDKPLNRVVSPLPLCTPPTI